MLYKRIRELRLAHILTQHELADKIDVELVSYGRYERGERTPSADVLSRLADALNCTTDYLLGKTDQPNIRQWINSQNIPKNYIRIPVLGRVPAGMPIDAIEDIIDYEDVSLDTISKDKEYFALKLTGDSMYPKYLDGDIVIVQQQPSCDSGQDAIVMVDGEDATFKKVILKEDSIVLHPYNPDYEPLYFSAKEIETLPVTILGIVIELRRSMV